MRVPFGQRIRAPLCTVRPRHVQPKSAGCGRYNARIRSFSAFRRACFAESFPDALGARSTDALVDREGLTQAVQALVVVAVLDVGPAESFEGTCFLWEGVDVAGDGQRPGVLVAGLAGGGGAE